MILRRDNKLWRCDTKCSSRPSSTYIQNTLLRYLIIIITIVTNGPPKHNAHTHTTHPTGTQQLIHPQVIFNFCSPLVFYTRETHDRPPPPRTPTRPINRPRQKLQIIEVTQNSSSTSKPFETCGTRTWYPPDPPPISTQAPLKPRWVKRTPKT